MSQKRMLLISYHFPPSGAMGGQRAARFARWLPSLGWSVTVLTVEEAFITGPRDPETAAALEATCEIVRVPRNRRLNDVLLDLKNRLKRSRPSEDRSKDNEAEPSSAPEPSEEEGPTGFLKWCDSVINVLEPEGGWVGPAKSAAKRLKSAGSFDCILTTSPPHATQLVGLAAKRIFPKAVFVADFRDPWLGQTGGGVKTRTSRKIESWLETRVLKGVDGAVYVTAEAAAATRDRYSRLNWKRFVLPNGIDSRSFDEKVSRCETEKEDKFVITHLGSFYLHRDPRVFLQGLKTFAGRYNLDARHLRVNFIGHCNQCQGVPLSQLPEAAGLEEIVKIRETISHPESLRLMVNSDVLLLFAQYQPSQVPGKTYEYLWARRPILCVSERRGATARLIEEVQGGVCVEPEESQGVVEALEKLYQGFLRNQPSPVADPAALARYDAPALAKQLDELVDLLSAGR